jgi:hypothetical protein
VVKHRLKVRYRLTPWWGRVLFVFFASRIVTTTILLIYAARQQANSWTGASPGYFDFARIWDGHWYYVIAVAGYPNTLPLTTDGHITESAWAFLPAYPSFVRVLMILTGFDFRPLAVLVSVGFALGAALLFYQLMRTVLPSETALFSVVLFCVAPLSPIFQVAYAESMHVFFLVLALNLLVRRKYWLLLPVIAVMSLTRPSGIAFALALGLHVIYRWFTRSRNPFPLREAIAACVATVFSAIMGFSWVFIAWAVTGSSTAYTDTELAWRAPYIGYQDLVPFTQLGQAARFWLQFPAGPAIVVITALLLVAFGVSLFTPHVKKLGVDIRFWLASYVLYLLAVFFPQSSTFRLLVPLFPILGAVAQPKSRVYRVAIVVACIAGQVLWVHIAWWVDGRDWTPP